MTVTRGNVRRTQKVAITVIVVITLPAFYHIIFDNIPVFEIGFDGMLFLAFFTTTGIIMAVVVVLAAFVAGR